MIDYLSLITKAERLRKKLGEDNSSPIDIFALAQDIEALTLVFYPLGNNLSGVCIKGDENRCTIAINSSMTLGRQRFTLAHEFYHLFYDTNMKSFCAKTIGIGSIIEKNADAFAAYFLMPLASLMDKTDSLIAKHNYKLNLQDIIRLEQYYGVSHQSMVYHLSNCGYLNKDELKYFLSINVIENAKLMGFSSTLYHPLENKQFCTYGHYIKQANELLKQEIISQGKYEELLLNAFRDDLVYGINEVNNIID